MTLEFYKDFLPSPRLGGARAS